MSVAVIYYSYSGNTRKYAIDLAKQENADVCEIKDKKRPSKFATFLFGCPKAMGHKTSEIESVTTDLSKYDRFIVCSPVWAGGSVPALNNVFDMLPKDKPLELHMISMSGESSKASMTKWIESKGYKLSKYIDIKK